MRTQNIINEEHYNKPERKILLYGLAFHSKEFEIVSDRINKEGIK